MTFSRFNEIKIVICGSPLVI